jgi:hypothetical protein
VPDFYVGQYVVTHDYRRGIVIEAPGKAGYHVVLFANGKKHHYASRNLSPSGVEPTDEECAVFMKHMLTSV